MFTRIVALLALNIELESSSDSGNSNLVFTGIKDAGLQRAFYRRRRHRSTKSFFSGVEDTAR